MTPPNEKRWLWIVAITVPFYGLDQLTKWWILGHIAYGTGMVVIPDFFNLVHVTNTGAAFGSFKNSNGPFIALSVVTLAVLTFYFLRGSFRTFGSKLAYALLASGILGNVTDRILHGHVIDFLDFDLHVPFANPWPSFNVADGCICVAAVLFLLASWKEDRKKAASLD